MIKKADDIYWVLKKFVLERVHGGDFDQGQSEKDTLSVLKDWWNENKSKLDGNLIEKECVIPECKCERPWNVSGYCVICERKIVPLYEKNKKETD